MSNQLADSTSPYLLQHKDNPVHWQEWGDAAFAEAARRDVPVFLSSGYSSCHWCHVMAHESFEDPELATFLNEHFVAVKVDRDERPDVDAVYMTALQSMTGRGGWPMSIFMTPAQEPFFAGTYYPPNAQHGSPAFIDVLTAVDDAWHGRRDDLTAAAARIVAALRERTSANLADLNIVTPRLLASAVAQLERGFDYRSAGFGGAPKFPPTSVLEFLLRRGATGDDQALQMAQRTCDAMARGGMYDQIGGGFARYSVDADWVVPHFEKMLYDNALLLRNYTHLFALTGSALARRIAVATADFLLREMQMQAGGFAASLDADSDGGEGNFYVWTPDQIRDALTADGQGPEAALDEAAWLTELCSVTESGTFEAGSSVLQLRADPDDWQRWEAVRVRLFAARSRRPRPALDESVITAWNGLVIGALAQAGAFLEQPRYIAAAAQAAGYLMEVHGNRAKAGAPGIALARVSRGGSVASAPGVLEDYANLASGLLDLFAVTGDERWYLAAADCVRAIIDNFRDDAGRLRDTENGSELVLDLTDLADNATPSGVSVATGVLVAFASLAAEFRDVAAASVAQGSSFAIASPRFGGWALAAGQAWISGSGVIAVVGTPTVPSFSELHLTALKAGIAGFAVVPTNGAASSVVPFLADRGQLDGSPVAFLCRDSVCQLPVNTPVELIGLVSAHHATTSKVGPGLAE